MCRGMVVVVLVTEWPGFEIGTPLGLDDGSALNPMTSTTASTAMTASHAQADRRKRAGLGFRLRRPRSSLARPVFPLARIAAMAMASSAETADESSGRSARICSGRVSGTSGTICHVTSPRSSRGERIV